MRNRYAIRFVIFFLIILLTFFLYKKNAHYTPNDMEIYRSLSDSIYLCLRNFELNNKDRGMPVPDFLLKQQNNLLDTLVKYQKPLLIFRFKETNCRFCINYELDMIKQYCERFKSQCFLVGSFENEGGLKRFLRMQKTDFPFCNVLSDAFQGWSVEQYESPYYFVLYPNHRVSEFFLPDKMCPALTENYLKGVERMLLN